MLIVCHPLLCPAGGQSPVAVEEEEADAAGGGAAVTGGGGAAVGGANGAGHPSDAIFDKFPECKSAKSLGQWFMHGLCV